MDFVIMKIVFKMFLDAYVLTYILDYRINFQKYKYMSMISDTIRYELPLTVSRAGYSPLPPLLSQMA